MEWLKKKSSWSNEEQPINNFIKGNLKGFGMTENNLL
jgi:hypothetical protein